MKPFRRKDRDGWWIRYKDADGRWVTRKGGDSEGEAYVALDEAETEVMLIRKGHIDPRHAQIAKESRRPIGEVVAEYIAYLTDRCSGAHVREAKRSIEAVIKGIGAKCLADIQQRPVERWLGDLLKRKRSARTYNGYRMFMLSLLNWAEGRRMVSDNPLRGIEARSVTADRREVSRALTPEEFDRLIQATPDENRRLYYLFAGRSGLRWQEIRRLRWEDLDLETGWVYPCASNTKSGRDDPLPLAPDLLETLKSRAKGTGPVFMESPTRRTFKQDLARAGIEYDGPRGQADRKSLRKTFGTHLAMAGVDFRVAVRLMRHKDPKLTQNIYTDPMLLDMKGAVSRLVTDTGVSGNQNSEKVG